MAFDYINEAFKKLKLLDEEMFDTSLNGIDALSNYIDTEEDETVKVIDPDAQEEENLQSSYVGKVIVNCNVCHSHVFKNKEDIVIEEDGSVNVEEQCPYCGESEGFVVIGEIAPYNNEDPAEESTDGVPEETDIEEVSKTEEEPIEESKKLDEAIPAIVTGMALAAAHGAGEGAGSNLVNKVFGEDADNDDENKPLRMSRASRRLMSEDFKEVSIKTEDQHLEMTSDEDGKITVVSEPVSSEIEEGSESIIPLSDETEKEILDNNSDVVEEPSEENDMNDEELDFEFDEIDEDGFDELGESYLRNVYDNVKSFKTTSVGANSNSVVVEGVIKFNSGVEKKTGFIFEAVDANNRGQLRFKGYNKHFTESTDAYSLIGRIDNKKLFVESLKYNYKVNEEVIRGRVFRK